MRSLRALLYARVSSPAQKRRKESTTDEPSLGEQLDRMEREARARGWEVVGQCEEVITGSVPFKDRPEGARVYDLAGADGFDLLMVYDNDRIGRDQDGVVAKVFRADMRFAGKQIFSIHQPVEPKTPDAYQPYADDSALWLESVSDTASSVYIRQFVRRRAFGMRKRVEVKKLMPGKLPIGYAAERHVLPSGRALLGERTADPQFAPIIRRIFAEYEEGASAQAIAVSLNADGLRTPYGNYWTAGTIHGILDNPVYYGAVAYHKHRCTGRPHPNHPRRRISQAQPKESWLIVEEGQHPPLISREQWDRCQAIRKARSTAGRTFGESTLLSGLVECGACGAPMNRSGSGHWVCSHARRTGGRECPARHYRVTWLEAETLGYLHRLVQEDTIRERLYVVPNPVDQNRLTEDLAGLSEHIPILERRLEKAREAYEAGVDSLAEFGERKRMLESELHGLHRRQRRLQERLERTSASTEAAEKLVTMLAHALPRFEALPIRRRKALLRCLIEKVVVGESTVHIRFRADDPPASEYDRLMKMMLAQSDDDCELVT